MLRLLVVMLIAVNGLYFAWSQGLLVGLGWAPANPREPERVANQIKPETISLLSAKEVKLLQATADKPSECLQSELLDDEQAKALRSKIVAASPAWPADTWALDKFTETASWMIFMGPYPNAQLMDKKKQELKRLNVKFEPFQNKRLGDGLMLASATEQALLDKQLAALNKSGVHTARILPLRTAGSGQVLKLPLVTDDLKTQIDAIKDSLPLVDGKSLRKCTP